MYVFLSRRALSGHQGNLTTWENGSRILISYSKHWFPRQRPLPVSHDFYRPLIDGAMNNRPTHRTRAFKLRSWHPAAAVRCAILELWVKKLRHMGVQGMTGNIIVDSWKGLLYGREIWQNETNVKTEWSTRSPLTVNNCRSLYFLYINSYKFTHSTLEQKLKHLLYDENILCALKMLYMFV